MNLPRLRAPAENGGVLTVPPLTSIGETLSFNRSILDRFAGAAYLARGEVVQQSCDYQARNGERVSFTHTNFIVAGHQPDLFHPGVWLKNFAICQLAPHREATSFNIVVDNDTLKSPTIRIPTGVGSPDPAEVHLAALAFDVAAGETPFEERTICDRATFESFGERLAEATRHWPYEPMGVRFWPRVVAQAVRTDNLGECLAAARRCVEREWGVANLELPTSRVAQTAAFRSFAASILTDLPRFHATYNAAVAEYRRTHRIRSRNHPVPDLGRDGDWHETPFWAWRTGDDRRGRLFARISGERMELRTTGDDWPSLRRDGIADAFEKLEGQGIKLRPRALTLTMFARLFLADLFVHGIGGGKYDELTDAIIARFFQVTPPVFLVLTGTLRPPFAAYPSTEDDLRRLDRVARDLTWNPQRHLPPEYGQDPLVARRSEWEAANPADVEAKRVRFRILRELTESLAPAVAMQRSAVRAELAGVKNEVAANAILRRRDFSFLLFPESMLRDWLTSAVGQPASPLLPTRP